MLGKEDEDVDQYAEKIKRKGRELQSLIKLDRSYFPAELIQGEKRGRGDHKRFRWDTKKDEFSLFEKLEEKEKEGEGEENKEKKDGDDEEPDEDLEKEEEESSDDDYNQNEYFDDDEDDFNMPDQSDEEYYE